VSPPNPREAAVARQRGWDASTRLACQARIRGDVVVQRLVRNAAEAVRLHAEELRGEPAREVPLAVLFCDPRDFTPLTLSPSASITAPRSWGPSVTPATSR
jgi:hypothetical protein